MGTIELDDQKEIAIIHSQGDGKVTVTIAQNNVSKAMIIMDANKTANLIQELILAYLSIAISR